MPSHVLRVARPTDNLTRVAEFYRAGLGFELLAQFNDHQGFDGVVLGRPGTPWHIEFTRQHGVSAGRAPTTEHLLVLYLPDQDEWAAAVERLQAFGANECEPDNPYWQVRGKTFEDPDGYRIVLQNAGWA
ncbi:VOC family protein [Paraburkholderia sp. PREW-6R]|uniref:VOC family protein n=1 Tax=Paraburkholderia sp. PREW-6R TaxID=3141544 RepID=UPI0031F5CA26